MIMRNIFFCVIVMLPVFLFARTTENSSSIQNGSNYELSVTSGIGSYYMPDMKDLQNTIIRNSTGDIPLFKTTSFPSYFNYSIKYGLYNNSGYKGLTCGMMSTGARSSISDYSGFYYSDINCMAFHIGYYIRSSFANYHWLKRPLEIGYIVNCSFLYSYVTLKDNLQLYGLDPLINGSTTLNSIGVYTEPMLYAAYWFSKYTGVELNAGGALSISSPLYFEKIKNEVVIFDKKRFANWSGYRISIGLITRF